MDGPVTLEVTRRTARTCATELVLPEHRIREELPLGRTARITFTPRRAGELRYACAMNMVQGRILVR